MNPKYDIHERIYHFVLRGLKLLASLPKTTINLIIIDQCGRSITSVGANDQEADASGSRKDFIAKYTIVKKELNESIYWFRLIGDLNPAISPETIVLLKEGNEIFLIISTILKRTKEKGRVYQTEPPINKNATNKY